MARPDNGSAGSCSHCDQWVSDGPDACLGTLPDVLEACCGHGWAAQPYVLLADGRRLEARAAIRWFAAAGVQPPPVATVAVRLLEQYDGRAAVTLEYGYESLRVVAMHWTNDADTEPVWDFDGTIVRLTRGAGVIPLPAGLLCSENPDGTVTLPVGSTGTMPDGG